jgi:transposase
LSFSGSLENFAAVEPCDMRRSFNGLNDAVGTKFNETPKSGAFFGFSNTRHSLLKILLLGQRRAVGTHKATPARHFRLTQRHRRAGTACRKSGSLEATYSHMATTTLTTL